MNDSIFQSSICDKVKSALQTFTPEERSRLTAIWQEQILCDGRSQTVFIGIRYTDQDGSITEFTDEKKINAIYVLEKHYRTEEEEIRKERERWMAEWAKEWIRGIDIMLWGKWK